MQWEDIVELESTELLAGFDSRMMLFFWFLKGRELMCVVSSQISFLFLSLFLFLYSIKDNLAVSICSSCSGRHALQKRLEQVVN